jgi:hypothetical protein
MMGRGFGRAFVACSKEPASSRVIDSAPSRHYSRGVFAVPPINRRTKNQGPDGDFPKLFGSVPARTYTRALFLQKIRA